MQLQDEPRDAPGIGVLGLTAAFLLGLQVGIWVYDWLRLGFA